YTRFNDIDTRLSSFDTCFAQIDIAFAKINTELLWLKWLLVTVAVSAMGPALVGLIAKAA
ncbi:MAG: hypothetical protein DRQ98_13170, partial [Gammaproteobacteria bacterium]